MIAIHRQKLLKICFLCLTFSLVLTSQAQDSPFDILKKIQDNKTEEAIRNEQRESRFRTEAEKQNSLMRKAEAEVAAQESTRRKLQVDFDKNEELLTDLESKLDKRVGDLGELFGVFRQVADDTETMIFDSLITLEKPERKASISRLAESTEIPTIPQMRELWSLLIEEAVLSGQTSRFTNEVVKPDGNKYSSEVIRVGTFNAITDDIYLNYFSENEQLAELARQPDAYIRSSANDLSSAGFQKSVGFYVDPSRGALLGLIVQAPSLLERIEQGRVVGYAILILTLIGMALVAQRLIELTRLRLRISNQLKDLDSPRPDNPLGRILTAYYENKHLNLETIKSRIEEIVYSDIAEIKKGLPVIKVLAAIAPLMGLLGTVTGMIGTFQAITLFGTGDPKLMAGGISQALVTTVLGLCAAIPLLLSHSLLSSQVTKITKTVGEQFLAVIATKVKSESKQETDP